jgi:hypothetical protein
VLRDLALALLDDPARPWRVSGTSLRTWTYQSVLGVPFDQVDAALEHLSAIAEHFTATTDHLGP